MIKIEIEWTFMSPFLKIISGIAKVYYRDENSLVGETLLTEFKITKEEGSRGYSSDEGIPSSILEAIHPQLDSMVDGVFYGVTLSKNTYQWVLKNDIEKSLVSLNKIEKRESSIEEKDTTSYMVMSDYPRH